jgi:hypothetical protein
MRIKNNLNLNILLAMLHSVSPKRVADLSGTRINGKDLKQGP